MSSMSPPRGRRSRGSLSPPHHMHNHSPSRNLHSQPHQSQLGNPPPQMDEHNAMSKHNAPATDDVELVRSPSVSPSPRSRTRGGDRGRSHSKSPIRRRSISPPPRTTRSLSPRTSVRPGVNPHHSQSPRHHDSSRVRITDYRRQDNRPYGGPSNSRHDNIRPTPAIRERQTHSASGRREDTSSRGRRESRCFKCGGIGHIYEMCISPHGAIKDDRTVLCHRCHGRGHLARRCPNNLPPEACYRCGALGHHARECRESGRAPEVSDDPRTYWPPPSASSMFHPPSSYPPQPHVYGAPHKTYPDQVLNVGKSSREMPDPYRYSRGEQSREYNRGEYAEDSHRYRSRSRSPRRSHTYIDEHDRYSRQSSSIYPAKPRSLSPPRHYYSRPEPSRNYPGTDYYRGAYEQRPTHPYPGQQVYAPPSQFGPPSSYYPGAEYPYNPNAHPNPVALDICYRCGSSGHHARSCPRRDRDRR